MILKPFGYTGKPGTCLWCGVKLYRKTVIDMDLQDRLLAEGVGPNDAYQQSLVKADKAGAYRDGFFCRMACGYQFGVRRAELGDRLQPPRPTAKSPRGVWSD